MASMKRPKVGWIGSCFNGIIEYETPKVVKVHNPGIGLLRRGLQLGIVLYVGLYQLYVARGYQEFAGIESSVTTKVKGYSISQLGDIKVDDEYRLRYERVWDEADYVIPPAENGAFFVTTNVVITPNQTWGVCPEDPREVPAECTIDDPVHNTSTSCMKNRNLIKSHGPQTGRCVPSDRMAGVSVCEISSWCPVEDDRLILGKSRPLITGSEAHTAFIKNSIRFSHFGDSFHRNNMPNGVCVYYFNDTSTHLCPIFILGDIVKAAGGNYTKMSVKGGVVAIHISWICNLDFDFLQNCLPKYNFRLLDTYGWNFRHAHFHEENRRTLYKAYGIKFVIIVQGRAGKFDLKNTVINIVAGLGLLSFITMFCDFILLHYMEERKIVKQKKFEILDRNQILAGLINIISATHVGTQAKESSECLLKHTSEKSSQWENRNEKENSAVISNGVVRSSLGINGRTDQAAKRRLSRPAPAASTNYNLSSPVYSGALPATSPRGSGNSFRSPSYSRPLSTVSPEKEDGHPTESSGFNRPVLRSPTVTDSCGFNESTKSSAVSPMSPVEAEPAGLRIRTGSLRDARYGSLRSHALKPSLNSMSPQSDGGTQNGGFECIDNHVLLKKGWTHHKVSNGQLSLHIVSQV